MLYRRLSNFGTPPVRNLATPIRRRRPPTILALCPSSTTTTTLAPSSLATASVSRVRFVASAPRSAATAAVAGNVVDPASDPCRSSRRGAALPAYSRLYPAPTVGAVPHPVPSETHAREDCGGEGAQEEDGHECIGIHGSRVVTNGIWGSIGKI